ncbi:MAG TPA: hypothetical protein VM580_25890 [Labilithrix sp.]|nr:hypothetical protein [Labilithrix sp.]
MTGDDKETKQEKSASSPEERRALPARVEQALARARQAAKADRERKGGRWLALVPVGIGAIFLALMMPRASVPESVPLPRVDLRNIAAVERADDARAAEAERARLPADILAVGTALRRLNGAEPRGGDEVELVDARRQLDASLRDLAQRPTLADELVALRAVQTRRFLDAIARWEAVGDSSEDYLDLAAAFVRRATDAGWVEGRRVLLSETERRAMFKTVWNVLTSAEDKPDLALTLDEQRALYAFYIDHPRPPESRRLSLEAQLEAANTPETCARANRELRRQSQLWLADKIKKLGQLDSSYPTAYALGVAYYRAGRFDLSAESFTAFVGAHPDGTYAIRARNHLKAALVANGAL